ncbi:MAG: hypothetical protein AAF549_00160 [Pseudomonadota bacterium]
MVGEVGIAYNDVMFEAEVPTAGIQTVQELGQQFQNATPIVQANANVPPPQGVQAEVQTPQAPQVTVDPQLIHDCDNAGMMPDMAQAMNQGDSLFGALCTEITNDIQELAQGVGIAPEQPEVPTGPVGDTADHTVHHTADYNVAASAPTSGMA